MRLKRFFLLILVLVLITGFNAGAENIVSGKVTIVAKDGKPKADNSDVVVFLDMPQPGRSFAPPSVHPVISQRGKMFVPEVLPIVVGTTVDFLNDDNIFHNVFSVSKPKPFDLGVYEQKKSKSVTFDKPGLVKLYCNIHPDMVAYILVLDNPYFAVTDKEGNFVIAGVPDGNHAVRVWQRFGDEAQAPVSVSGSRKATVDFRITEGKAMIKHKNKWGQDYPAKY